MTELSVPHRAAQAVIDLIHLTQSHDDPGDALGRALIDADLLILSAPRPIYESYALAIRREYDWVPEETYRGARRMVLDHFLQRPRMYWTDTLEQLLAQPARENLTWEIAAL